MEYSEEAKLNTNDVILFGRVRYGIDYSTEEINELVREGLFPKPDKVEITMSVNGETSRYTYYSWKKSVVSTYFQDAVRQFDEDYISV